MKIKESVKLILDIQDEFKRQLHERLYNSMTEKYYGTPVEGISPDPILVLGAALIQEETLPDRKMERAIEILEGMVRREIERGDAFHDRLDRLEGTDT